MKETDKLLINSYASFVIDSKSLQILDYNDYASRYLTSVDLNTARISDLIEWDESISNRIDFKRERRLSYLQRIR